MVRRSRLVALSFVVATACLVGCSSGDERPGTMSDDVTSPVVGERTWNPRVCTPSEMRTCHQYYVDAFGQLNCPETYQFCNDDGTEWYPCGEYDVDPATRQPVPPSHPSTGKRPPQADAGAANANDHAGSGSGNGNGGKGKP